ncbi:MAG: DUF1800 family protein [Bacteroidota bacterium]
MPDQQKNLHLLWRAGFGPAVEQLNDLDRYRPDQFWSALVEASQKSPEPIEVASNAIDGLVMGVQIFAELSKKELDADQRKQLQQRNRTGIRDLNSSWMRKMVNSSAQLREKMALFWHGHFACRNLNVLYQQQLLDIIRQQALGNFGTLLKLVSRSAAMLNFLNNQQNKKDHPNENFAREVMELFTMGRGNYTETDIKEAARAFTGWASNFQGEFVFRRLQHDFGSKTFLGRTGQFDGEDILNRLLEEKQTATFLTTKLYRFFVNDTPDPKHIEWLAGRFYENQYEILPLLQDIFTSDWFYEKKNMGTHIKSPVELLVGVQRMLPIQFEDPSGLLLLQRGLGQVLFYPPNVAGWPGGKTWIDSSSLMLRMRVPRLLLGEDDWNVQGKTDDDVQMGMMQNMQKRFAGQVDWSILEKAFEKIPGEQLPNRLIDAMLLVKRDYTIVLLKTFVNPSDRNDSIHALTAHILSTPEYQLS